MNKGAMRVARRLRQEMRDRGEFTVADYQARLAVRLEELRGELFDDAVAGIAERIDKESRSEAREFSGQRTLWDIEGEYALGDSRRISKEMAHIDHADISLALLEKDWKQKEVAFQNKKKEIDRLRPYWGPGVTKKEAIAAYLADNPSAGGNVA